MKSFKKIIFRLFKFGVIAILIIYIGLFIYFKFGWKNHYYVEQVDNLITSVQNTPALSDSFYLVYDKVSSDRHERITNRYLKSFWPEFFMIKQPRINNWQLRAARIIPFKGYRYINIAPMTLAFKIDKEVTPEKCFDYIMTKRFSDYSNRFKLNDTISNLKQADRIIEFIVANERPSYYRVHPTEYKQKTDSLKKNNLFKLTKKGFLPFAQHLITNYQLQIPIFAGCNVPLLK